MTQRRDPEEPLPYGLPPEEQEVYFDVLYPNLDKVAGASFDPGTVNGRRGRRGFIVVAAVVGVCVVVAGIGILIQTLTGALN
ncbi:hypothetical protein ACPPVQ_10755 [Diaminobutyricibacter sp. McL0618]|uniref:hypothetical protein n=1 Tax=Leifsonia sp. McL0618 TaxID=3415677 RepID=UPI003CF01FB5